MCYPKKIEGENDRILTFLQTHCVATQKINYMYFWAHDILDSHVTCLNGLINHLYLIHVNSLINRYVMNWKRFLQPGLEENFVRKTMEHVCCKIQRQLQSFCLVQIFSMYHPNC